jgi:type IX secretion system PorP/SprF family membrane protein
MNYKINLQEVDNRFTSTDPGFISTSNPSQWMPMVGLGLFYNTEKFYVGASTPSILKSRMSGYTNINSSMQNQNSFHFFISSGFVMDLDENVKVKPSTLLKIVSGAPVECDVNVNFWLHDMLGIGGSYRTGDSYVSMLELQATDQLRIGYAYDIPFSPLKYFTKGSHEIMIRYELGNNNYRVKSNRHF